MARGIGNFPDGLFGFGSAQEVFLLIVMLLAMGVFIHIASRMVIKKSTLQQAFAAAVLASLGFYIVSLIVTVNALALIIGAVAFAAVIGAVYKTKDWTKGASIGAVAWVLFQLSWVLLDWIVATARA